MKITSTELSEVFIVEPLVHEDSRGFFMETYRSDTFADVGINEVFVQDNQSYSKEPNTVRGLNFQLTPPMGKIMRVTQGSAFLVAVDIRRESPTLGKWVGIVASSENKIQLYAPAGFARGFQTLVPDTEVTYKCSAFHNAAGEGEVLWNDPAIGIVWPLPGEPIMSERNRNAPLLADWLTKSE